MNLNTLRYFIVASETLNFTKASAQLYVSQQVISGCIRTLEKELGTDLFERDGNHVTLTYAGLRFKNYAKEMLRIDHDMRAEMERLRQSEHGMIALGINETRAYALLPAVMPNFYEEYPYVGVSTSEGFSSSLQQMLINRHIDFVVGAGLKQPGVSEYQISTDKMCLLMPKQFVSKNIVNSEISEKDFISKSITNLLSSKEMPFVMLNKQTAIRQWTDQYLEKEGIVPKIVFETNGVSTMFSMVEQGVGISFCQESLLYSFRNSLEAKKAKVNVFPIESSTAPIMNLSLFYNTDFVFPEYTKRLFEMIGSFYRNIVVRYDKGTVSFDNNRIEGKGRCI